jgi:hypothetical protein
LKSKKDNFVTFTFKTKKWDVLLAVVVVELLGVVKTTGLVVQEDAIS